jgi:hypothetical protein
MCTAAYIAKKYGVEIHSAACIAATKNQDPQCYMHGERIKYSSATLYVLRQHGDQFRSSLCIVAIKNPDLLRWQGQLGGTLFFSLTVKGRPMAGLLFF